MIYTVMLKRIGPVTVETDLSSKEMLDGVQQEHCDVVVSDDRGPVVFLGRPVRSFAHRMKQS